MSMTLHEVIMVLSSRVRFLPLGWRATLLPGGGFRALLLLPVAALLTTYGLAAAVQADKSRDATMAAIMLGMLLTAATKSSQLG